MWAGRTDGTLAADGSRQHGNKKMKNDATARDCCLRGGSTLKSALEACFLKFGKSGKDYITLIIQKKIIINLILDNLDKL